MGALITLRVVNERPDLFRGVVFVGPAFGPVPLAVWGFNRGAFFLPNQEVYGASFLLHCRSAFAFLPRRADAHLLTATSSAIGLPGLTSTSSSSSTSSSGNGSSKDVDGGGGGSGSGGGGSGNGPTPLVPAVDYFDPLTWRRLGISPALLCGGGPASLDRAQATTPTPPPTSASGAASVDSSSSGEAYVASALQSALAFHESLAFRPGVAYPPFAVVRSSRWPTPARFASSLTPAAAAAATSAAPAGSSGVSPHSTPPPTTSSTTTTTTPSTLSSSSSSSSPLPPPPPGEPKSASGDAESPPATATSTASERVRRLAVGLPSEFAAGDGVVPAASAVLPAGYACAAVVPTAASHVTMLNDLDALAEAFRAVLA
ncbi:hypothetical protein HK405_012654 [Cladochytrium tenue]|nr:hypothetical protein HK405_012654 [Cladochytrium tenue]